MTARDDGRWVIGSDEGQTVSIIKVSEIAALIQDGPDLKVFLKGNSVSFTYPGQTVAEFWNTSVRHENAPRI